jgi:low temperature requirement protein LtrA
MIQVIKEKLVAITGANKRRSAIVDSARPTSEDDTATTFELFFDLVYVFAMTQVTAYMVHAHDALGVLQGLLVLALLWWTWCAYAWLGNQARADTGVVRAAMAVAMAALFVVALTIPEAWDDAEGGLDGPIVLVGAYLLVRCVHLSVYALAARGDPGLRRQLAISWGPTVAGALLLMAGVLLEGQLQTVFFAGALVVDWGGIYLTSREGNWRIHSAPHWTERHGLFIILAIGESVVAIGVGAAGQPISAPLLAAGVLGIVAALCLWWLYFDVVSRAAEHRLRDARGQARVRMALEAYTYGHFPIVAGIIVGAVGVEGVLAHAGDGEALGLFYAAALYGGVALYLAGHLLFKQRMYAALSVGRLVTVGVLLLALPAAAFLPPLLGLVGLVLLLSVLIGLETRRYAALRAGVRPG